MNLLNRWIMACSVLGLLAAVGTQDHATEAPSDVCTRDVIYGRKAGLALTMDVFRPKEKANGAALLWLQSGDFASTGDVHPFDPEPVAEYLHRGYTVFAVCHGSTPVFPVDEIVADIHRAVRYIRHHAKDYRIDPDQLAILGMSSGGFLSAHVGVSGGEGPPFPKPDYLGIGRYDPIEVEESSKVAAFVNICGLTDLLNYGTDGKCILEYRFPEEIRKKAKIDYWTAPFAFRDYHRGTGFTRVTDAEEMKRRLKAVSPVYLVSAKSSPGLIIHGEKDGNVPVQQAESLAKRLRAAGVPVDLVIRKDAGHDVFRWREDDKLIADWLDKRLAPSR
jgi:acetyl esterase/lipase